MLRFYYIVFFMLCNTVVFSLTITIDEAAVADVNIDNTGGVITPTGPGAILTNESLTAALSAGNVTINTNGAGDISFDTGSLINYSASAERTLTLIADGNILTMHNTIGASSPVNYIIQTTGNVTISSIGINTFGGDMNINTGGTTTITSNGLATGGGNVDIETDGMLTINNNGLNTGGGNVDIETDGMCTIDGGGLTTGGGTIDIETGGTTTIQGGGLTTGGGNIDIETGGTTTIQGSGLTTDGGTVDIETDGILTIQHSGMNVGAADHVNLMANGTITIQDNGIQATNPNFSLLVNATTSHDIEIYVQIAGGEVELIGNNIETVQSGLSSSGSTDVNIYAAGDFTATSNGVNITGGSVAICAGNNILVEQGGMGSGGGSIALQAEGTITLNDNSANSSPGTGGVLTVTEGNPGSIIQNVPPTVGGGDILLNTNYVFSLPAPPAPTVPTIGQWGLIILGLLFMIFGVIAIIDSKISTLNYR